MAVMAPGILFRDRGSSIRKAAVTGSLVGAAAGEAVGAGAAGAAEPLSWPTAPAAQINSARSTSACLMKILLIFFSNQRTSRFRCEVRPVSHEALREGRGDRRAQQREESPPAEDDGIRRAALYFADSGEADCRQNQRPDHENVERGSDAVQEHAVRRIHKIAWVGGQRILEGKRVGTHAG